MALDPGLLELLREDLGEAQGITEKKMFGGICFLLNGSMVCGISKEGLMFRVGKAAEAEALALPGVRPLGFTGRPMGGMVELPPEAGDDGARSRLVALSLAYALALPPKAAKG